MSDITPKPIAAVTSVAPMMSATATAAPPATATAAEIPAAVANLSVGTLVTGTVIERGARGLIVLRTDKGTIKLQSPIPLRQGSTVTLQIQSVGAQTQLSILSIDGNPLAPAAGKMPAIAPRPDAVAKPAGIEGSSTRATPVSTTTAQTTSSTANPADGATLRSAPTERGITARATTAPAPQSNPQAGAPAPAFVARPLIGPAVSASLEALSVQQPATASAASATLPGASPTSAATLPASGAPASVLTAGDRFLASFIAAPAAPSSATTDPIARAAPAASAPSSTSSATNSVSLAAGASPQANGATRAMANPGAATAPGTTIASPAAPTTASPGTVMLRLVGVEPAASALMAVADFGNSAARPAGTPLGALHTLTGTIVDSAQAAAHPMGTTGRVLISTPLGMLSLPGEAPGPPGTRLLFELLPRSEMPPLMAARSDLANSVVTSASGRGPEWAVLRDIITATTVADPGLADHLLNATLPRVGPNFAAGLLVFVAALRQGNPRAWLGEQTVDALQRSGHGGLIDKLSDEFAALNRLAAETSPGGWQTLLVPLFDGERIQQMRLYMRRPRRKNGERGGTRFMIEAELTKLGTVQLDGLISKPQFDLVVRTRSGLPPEMRGDIIEIFGDALLATHLKGTVIFQVTADLRPGPPESDGEAGIGLIV